MVAGEDSRRGTELERERERKGVKRTQGQRERDRGQQTKQQQTDIQSPGEIVFSLSRSDTMAELTAEGVFD